LTENDKYSVIKAKSTKNKNGAAKAASRKIHSVPSFVSQALARKLHIFRCFANPLSQNNGC
jgi:hypothetical protein